MSGESQSRPHAHTFWVRAVLVISCALAIGYAISDKHATDALVIRNGFVAEQRALAQETRDRVEETFSQLYKGLRTIARLPGVRSIRSEHLEANAASSVQEIYNNLASGVALSEVYIVGANMDPDAIDPRTGALGAPIVMFDQLIVGQSATPEESSASALPEEEIHEYRLIKRQLDHFKRRWSDERVVAGLDYPALAGEEVITCDNTRFNADHPNDRDRKGLVYSVPFYSPDGQLRGTVTGVVLSHALRDLMPSGRYVLYNRQHGYFVTPREAGAWEQSEEYYRSGRPNPRLAYSEVIPLNVVDDASEWVLWTGIAEAAFAELPQVEAEIRFTYLAYTMTLVIAALVLFTLYVQERHRARLARNNAELEDRVRQRTHDLDVARQRAEDATRAKSAFLATMSHEIRTPMNGIVGMAQALQNTQLSATQRRYADTLTAAASALIATLNDLLDISKIEAGKMDIEHVDFDLHQMLKDICELMTPRSQDKGLSLILDIAPDVPQGACGDSARLRQIVTNLVSNAVKFTHRGGVTLRCACTYRDGDTALLKISVVDTGIGIDTETQVKLFQPFTQADSSTTRKYGGTGLGLAICKRLSELMNGRMGVDSSPGVGSTFWIELPLVVVEGVPHRGADPSTSATGRTISPRIEGARILVVDDVEFNRDVIDALLTGSPVELDFADSGAAAVEKARSNRYDVILMDCQMPTMDGFEATRRIRALEPSMKHRPAIVALTANASSQDRDACLASGMDDFISKPVEQVRLIATLEKWLPQARATSSPAHATPAKAASVTPTVPRVASIDLSYIRDIERELDTEFERVLRTFAADMQKLALKLEHAQQVGDKLEMLRVLHSIKGVSGYLGATRLASLADELSVKYKSNSSDFSRNEVQSIIDEHNLVREKLNELYGSLWARAANLLEAGR